MENIKLCQDCKWCKMLPATVASTMSGAFIEKNTECDHPKNIIEKIEKSYITGKDVDLSYKIGNCNGQRFYKGTKNDNFCGIDAYWFEPKE